MKRLPTGGTIDRTKELSFSWNGQSLQAHPGDTLASALLANGIAVIGSSVSLKRPRGVMSAGAEEAHAFAQLGEGGASEPLARATSVEVFDGLVARGLSTKGILHEGDDPSRPDRRTGHCDVLVIGGGPTGLVAARTAASGGARVILADQRATLGGALPGDRDSIDGQDAAAWVAAIEADLEANPEVRLLRRTTAVVALDQNGMMLVERRPNPRLWQIRARQIILATGSLERPIVFQDNDRPGIMLAAAVRRYLHQFALVPERTVVFTTNDDAYRTAIDLVTAGQTDAAVVDPRPEPTGALAERARDVGIRIIAGSVVTGTDADAAGVLIAVTVASLADGEAQRIECDLLAVSGGFDPALDLHHQRRGGTTWNESLATFVATEPASGYRVAGALAGSFDLAGCLRTGVDAGQAAAAAAGFPTADPKVPDTAAIRVQPAAPIWQIPAPDQDESRSFVDLHRDATVAGVHRAMGAGIRSAEHLKRYTLIGTGVEQGRTSKVNAGMLAARYQDGPMGTSSARPPVEPIAYSVLAGRARGAMFEPVRTTPIHPAHVAAGAVFENVGQWKRPRYYPRAGESMAEAVQRECRAVRQGVAMMDASTLGKIDVQGPDAAEFLERLYLNKIANLKPGRARYSAMCRLDGILFDDGVIMRLAEDRFFVTTSTSHAAPVMEWMEEWLQTEWPDLRVWLTSITEQWATIALVGPLARTVLAAADTDLDLSAPAFPFMAVRSGTVAGMAAQVARVSFSGELAFEVSVPGYRGEALWNTLMAAGISHGIEPYGLEALSLLRAEKGFLIVGQDTDASTTPTDAGLGWMMTKERDFIGKRSLRRKAMVAPGRRRLVGFLPADPAIVVLEGAQLVEDPAQPKPMTMIGHVTSSFWSATLGRSFGLAMVKGGAGRLGQTLYACSGSESMAVTIVDPVFYDREGARRDG